MQRLTLRWMLLLAVFGLAAPALAQTAEEDPVPEGTADTSAEAAAEAAPAPAPSAQTKVSVTFVGVKPTVGVNPDAATAVGDWVEARVTDLGVFRVVGEKQIKTLLTLDQQKQLLGCEDNANCYTDYQSVLATDRILTGSLSQIGKSAMIKLSLIDVKSAELIASGDRRVKIQDTIEPLLDHVQDLVREIAIKDPGVSALPPPVENLVATLPGGKKFPTLSDIRKDPRNGFLIGLRGSMSGGNLLLGAGFHGQGGAIGMGLAGLVLKPGDTDQAYGARVELRVTPLAWRFLAPYASTSVNFLVFPEVPVPDPAADAAPGDTVPLMRLSPALHLGVQASYGYIAAALDVGYAFEVGVIETDAEADYLKGFTAGLWLYFRI